MSELKPRIKENGIDYILVGDYYIPDLKLPEEHRPIGKYGREIHGFIHSGVVRHAQQEKLAQPQLENKTRFHVQLAFPEGSDDVVQPGLVAQYAEDQSLHQVPVCRWKRSS